MEQWRQTLAEGTRERALFDDEFKLHLEKPSQICEKAVGQFGALAVEGCKLAQGTKLDLTTIYASSVIDPEQITKVTTSAPATLFEDSRVQIRDNFSVLDLFSTMHLLYENYQDEFAELDGQLDVANLIQCTICKAKVAEFCLARARDR